jgi:3-hydroxybutyryl-CoA dehydratase
MAGRMFTDPQEKWFEDFELGDCMITRGRTVDIGDITNFAGMTGDHYQLHTDAAFMEKSRFGQRIAHGPLTFSLAVGLIGGSGFYGDAIAALVEITGLKATKPVFSGDTINVVAEVTALDASGAKYGTISVAYTVKNQNGEDVMTFLQTMLAKRQPMEG